MPFFLRRPPKQQQRRIPAWLLTSLCWTCTITAVASQQNVTSIFSTPSLRGAQNDTVLCRMTMVDTLFQVDASSSMDRMLSTSCIVIENNRETDEMLPVTLPSEITTQYGAQIHTGSLFVTIRGAAVQGDALAVASNAKFTVMEDPPEHLRQLHARQLVATGTKTLAIIRICTSDSCPNVTNWTLRRTIMGIGVGFRSQYAACSFGQLEWKLSSFGIRRVKVNNPVASYSSATALITDVQNQLKASMGITAVSDIADKVMMVVPPGTGNWIGSAGVGHWRAQFNNDWTLSLTASMHEIGHTLGLTHSNKNGIAYSDSSGYMAAGHKSPRWPRKCFNGYNYMALGWLQDRWLSFDPTTESSPRQIQLATFVDYNTASVTQPVLVIVSNDFYLVYNRAKSFNADTEAMQDMVTVTQLDSTGTENRAGLVAGESYTVSNYKSTGRNLVIAVCQRVDGPPDVMVISVGMGASACG